MAPWLSLSHRHQKEVSGGVREAYSSWVENAHTLLFFGVAIIGWLAESKGSESGSSAAQASTRQFENRRFHVTT